MITIATTMSFSGTLTALLNGVIDNNFFFNSQSVAGLYVQFTFLPLGGAVVIDEAKWYQDSATGQGTWQWQGSNDGSSWTNIGATFTLGGATPFQTSTSLNGNTTGYAYYRLLGVSGSSSSSPWCQEIEFKISGSTAGAAAPSIVLATAVPIAAGPNHQVVRPASQTNQVPTYFSPVPVGAVLQSAFVGTAYSETITASGGTPAYTYSLTGGSLPTGLTLSSGGVISGTPSAAGTYTFTVRVTDSNGNTGSTNFEIDATVPTSAVIVQNITRYIVSDEGAEF